MLLALNPMPTAPLSSKADETPLPAAEPLADATVTSAAEVASLRAEVGELRSILETATDGVVVVLSGDGEIRFDEPLGLRALQL